MSTDPITSQAAAALGRMNAGKRKNLSPEARAALAARCAARNRERGERIRAARAVHLPIPKDYPVQPLKSGQAAQDKASCGHCGLSWDDAIITSITPAPSGRCPFEAFHVYQEKSEQ